MDSKDKSVTLGMQQKAVVSDQFGQPPPPIVQRMLSGKQLLK